MRRFAVRLLFALNFVHNAVIVMFFDLTNTVQVFVASAGQPY